MGDSLTVIEVTGRLGIGGVETHVSRLALGLMRRGHRIIVLTERSGVFEEEARDAGADLLVVPFDEKGRRQVADRIKPGSVDLIHAHNYGPARFAAPLARVLGVPYLMTVHGPRPWYKRALFRDWSDTVLTVSEADRDDVTGPFGPPADRVRVSFLGVDTDRFRPGLEGARPRGEWQIPENAPLVVNVSRFSHRKARPGLALLDALPLLLEEIPAAHVVFVGDGPKLDRIRKAAVRVNDSLGRRVARVVGARTDIPEVMNAADVVIAAATTAIEALACGTPTIAFGRTGYFGIVTPDNFEDARAVCFADHGHLPARVSALRLADDLIWLLKDRAARRHDAEEIRAALAERYSVDRLAEQIELVYHQAVGRTAAGQVSKTHGVPAGREA